MFAENYVQVFFGWWNFTNWSLEVAGVIFFRLRLRSCFEMFKSGSAIFLNLRIRLFFRLQLPSIQPKFTNVFTYEMTTQTPVTAENEKWLRIRVRFFTKFWLRVRKKNPESCRSRPWHSGSVASSAGQFKIRSTSFPKPISVLWSRRVLA